MKDKEAEIEKVPNYLTKRNESFRQIIYQARPTTTTTGNAADFIEKLSKNKPL